MILKKNAAILLLPEYLRYFFTPVGLKILLNVALKYRLHVARGFYGQVLNINIGEY